MLRCDLETVYGDLWASVHTPAAMQEGVVLTSVTLPPPPAKLSSDRIIVTRSTHEYNWSVGDVLEDRLILYADRPTLANLGLWILSMVFHAQPDRSVLRLRHEGSDIRDIACHYDHDGVAWGSGVVGYKTIPAELHYFFEKPERFPLSELRHSPNDLPRLFLTDQEGSASDKFNIPEALTLLTGFGPERATVRFARLLLDIGGSSSTDPNFDIDLETEIGSGGVSPGSVELAIVTPGTHRWQAVAAIDPGFGE